MFIRQPFDEFLEMKYERITENSVKLTLPIKPVYVHSVGVIHDDQDQVIAKAKAILFNQS